jgi:two-component system OmpR family sensor kinase
VWQKGFRGGQLIAWLLGRWSLRVRLVATAVCLLAAGAGVIGAASGLVARGYLMRQADQQLRAYAGLLTSGPFTATPFCGPAPGVSSAVGCGGGAFRLQVRGSAGQLVMSAGPGTQSGPASAPVFARVPARAGQLVTIAAAVGGSWRVIAEPVHYQARRIPFAYSAEGFSVLVTSTARPGLAGTLVVGLDLGSIGQAVGRLTVTWLAVSGVVIVAVAGLGVAMTRTILRPITQMQQTAELIAAGELARRVPDRHGRSDVGRLAWSLNQMLNQIEQAFSTRAESQAAARKSAEQMCRITADTGHELRRPLSIIHGFAAYHRQRGQLRAGELDQMMRRVADEAARMRVLIDDLLLTCDD